MNRRGGRRPGWLVRSGAGAAVAALFAATDLAAQSCSRTFVANVVAIEQFIWYNRLGAHEPDQLMYVLRQDLVSSTGGAPTSSNHQLRDGKRPRPLVLRVTAGSCLKINFTNWLSSGTPGGLGTDAASVHVTGMQLVNSIADDGSHVGQNASSLVNPGQSTTYTLFAEREGTYLMYSTAQTTGADGNGGQIGKGLFGAVNVEPAGAEFYRSQLSRSELDLATDSVTAAGYPAINYDKRYPALHPQSNRYIVRMTTPVGDTIVHADMNAIITGPNRGNFSSDAYPNPGVAVYNHIAADSRLKPFREFTVIFHDEVGLVQAFDTIFRSERLEHTLHGGRDAFAINYGTGGIGAEIIANRLGVGPMANCNECKFEEFFLSSWVVGDPAMVVDKPAGFTGISLSPGPATVARYPSDPSNVFHSYLNDHVKIRNLHAGPKEHHVFHLHAHQWLHTPNSDGSNYLDSQTIGPGGGFTYEITYGGSGNRNETPGDAILHCHFYPHFAQGMWGLWRVHDVFERGTVLDGNGRPATGSRALPDGEIVTGTPIPAVVPIPTYAMAPVPTSTFPGYPFYIPGVAGHRPPKPPLDTRFDGGLPRHVVTGGLAVFPALNSRDFSKRDSLLAVNWLPETGTPLELAAMAHHERLADTTRVAGQWSTPGLFHLNGLPRRPGAPFADPCGIRGVAMGVPDSVKAAAFQLDTIYFNKARWNFTQHRMFGLWSDVNAFLGLGGQQRRPPEPMFFRVHDNTCLTYHLVNLVPEEYEQDDFQVQTPTDVIGQHIHLVKFDVTSSDGAANGFNYEDGSLAPGDVRHRLEAIRRYYNCTTTVDAANCVGPALPHPTLGAGPDSAWVGAQETLQRWWVDPVLRGNGKTSPLGAVFTHDHFGPSTHQQAGLYAAMLPEDSGTTWRDPETGTVFGTRADGGPTSWRADILYADTSRNFREFNLQIADFTLAYGREGFRGSIGRMPPINPPGKDEVGLPDLLRPPFARNGGPPGRCPNDSLPPCPEILSADDPGTMVVNYRNEPMALRVRDTLSNGQAAGERGDLSYVYSSGIKRADTRLNGFGPYGRRPGVLELDPFTPLMRVYEDDRVRVNLLVGAQEEGHNINIRGTRWLSEPRDWNSGWRNSQVAGISEFHQFFLTPLIGNPEDYVSDFVYEGGATDDRWNGLWGLLRMYRTRQRTLCLLTSTVCPQILTNTSDRKVAVGGQLTTDDSTRVFTDETGEAVSLSLAAARADTTPAKMDGFQYLDPKSPFPTPSDTTTWRGSTTLVQAAKAADASFSFAPTSPPDAQDSVKLGYGNLPVGGVADYDQFDYYPGTNTEVLTAGTAPPTGLGFTFQGTIAYKIMPPGPAGEYELPGDKYTASGVDSLGFYGVCPRVAPVRYYDVSAIDARSYLPGRRLVYNHRTANGGPLVDSAAILYVFTADLDLGIVQNDTMPEPLVLRANPGECVMVRLHNQMQVPLTEVVGWNTLPPIVDQFNANDVDPSEQVGLHAQLVGYDVQLSDGSRAGVNRNTTVAPDTFRWFTWYAGDVRTVNRTFFRATPIEFGGTNLMPSDPIEHASKGAIAALILEPRYSEHHRDPGEATMATIKSPVEIFRELALLWQDDLNLQFGSATTLQRFDCDPNEPMTEEEKEVCEETGDGGEVSFQAGDPVPNLAEAEDPEDSGQKAVNYRTEPMWIRLGFAPNAELGLTRQFDFRNSLADVQVNARPQTPILTAFPGQPVRFRILQPGGHARNKVFNLHGHVWEELPYENRSQFLGSYFYSEWKGTRDGHGPGNHHDVLPKHGAGGLFGVEGEYLWRDQASFLFDGGIWGLMTVSGKYAPVDDGGKDETPGPGGFCTINATTGQTSCTP
jgi:hypothetical protein